MAGAEARAAPPRQSNPISRYEFERGGSARNAGRRAAGMPGRSCTRAAGAGRWWLVGWCSQQASRGRPHGGTRTHAPAASALSRPRPRAKGRGGSWLAGERGARVGERARAGGVGRGLLGERVRRLRAGSAGARDSIYRGRGGACSRGRGWLAGMQARCSPQPPVGLCDPGAELRWASTQWLFLGAADARPCPSRAVGSTVGRWRQWRAAAFAFAPAILRIPVAAFDASCHLMRRGLSREALLLLCSPHGCLF